MAEQARFQLTTAGKQFAQAGYFRFRVAFTGSTGGVTRYYQQRDCPVIQMGHPGLNDVLGTTNVWAISNMRLMKVPDQTRRGGSKKDSGLVFEDVTSTTTPGDVDQDLDVIFDIVRNVGVYHGECNSA